MKVFYDTNVILDVLLNRAEFLYDSLRALKYSENRAVRGFVSVVSITDMYYVIKRNLKDASQSLQKIQTLLDIVQIAKADRKTVLRAVKAGWPDFEDAMQYAVAKKTGVACIVTRNKKDFVQSDIPVYTPAEFLVLMQK